MVGDSNPPDPPCREVWDRGNGFGRSPGRTLPVPKMSPACGPANGANSPRRCREWRVPHLPWPGSAPPEAQGYRSRSPPLSRMFRGYRAGPLRRKVHSVIASQPPCRHANHTRQSVRCDLSHRSRRRRPISVRYNRTLHALFSRLSAISAEQQGAASTAVNVGQLRFQRILGLSLRVSAQHHLRRRLWWTQQCLP